MLIFDGYKETKNGKGKKKKRTKEDKQSLDPTSGRSTNPFQSGKDCKSLTSSRKRQRRARGGVLVFDSQKPITKKKKKKRIKKQDELSPTGENLNLGMRM
eukprot:m.113958 g.113958  ORF g.113958 m.113958 type:complete len:100 (+) comp28312_c1_seq2:2115-2414(+)